MRMTSHRLTSLVVSALLCLSVSQESVNAAFAGTVKNALVDYIMNLNKSPPTTPQPSSNTQQVSGTNTGSGSQSGSGPGSGSGSGSSMFDLYSQMMQGPPQQTMSRSTSSAGGSSGQSSYMDILNQMTAGSKTQQSPPQQASNGGTALSNSITSFMGSSGGSPQQRSASSGASDPMSFYSQLVQAMNSPPVQTAPQSHMPPFTDPFPATPAPPPTPKPPPKYIPFVPPEWNLTQASSQSGWREPSPTTGWGHHAVPPRVSAWEHQRPRPLVPRPTPTTPHPMSQLTMVPRVRDMINKQATQFGDLAYYQQHGCIDPTPTKPGPGGIRPTQTLWYGCQSPVSRMVCMRVGKRAGGKSSTMAMMMSMMNPVLTATMEKCLSPRMTTQMMFQGFSGGKGGMNPMMMMALNGGGGGGMSAMMPMMMMMMMKNQQGQAAATAGTLTSSPMPTPLGPSPAKQAYPDPSRSNTLISQAARIPHGAAQPAQSSGTSLMGAFRNMLGLGSGGSQTPAPSSLPTGAATSGASPLSPGPGQGQGQGLDCSSVMPLMMSRMMAAGEGLNSPEAMEAIGELRKQFLPYSCQELRIKYTGLPLRLCCPGKVDPPTVFDLFKAKNAGGA